MKTQHTEAAAGRDDAQRPKDRAKRHPTRPGVREVRSHSRLAVPFLAGCASNGQAQSPPTIVASTTAPSTTSASTRTTGGTHPDHDATMSANDRAAAAAGDRRLPGCRDRGGRRVRQLAGHARLLPGRRARRDGRALHQPIADGRTVDITKPEALVYELDATGHITGLVAHEYIVPVDAWKSAAPPKLFGVDFHRHPTLPLWVLHTWLWKDNPTGVFEDWNPAVRLCPRRRADLRR